MSDVLRIGHGSPVTVFASGQGAGIADTAALAVGVHGSRVFFEYGRVVPWARADVDRLHARVSIGDGDDQAPEATR